MIPTPPPDAASSDHPVDFPARSDTRNRGLDGLRGVLAVVVLVWHAVPPTLWFLVVSQVAVLCFFVISAYVLTRSWEDRYPAFLLRRFVRLWPLYALSLAAGYALAGRPPIWTQFFWWPLIGPNDPIQIDQPAWSLCIEAWAMLAMPLVVWLARGAFVRRAFGVLACIGCLWFAAQFIFGFCFILGAYIARAEIRLHPLERWLPQWLGRISYPLYLTHWLVLTYLPGPMLGRILVAFVVAQVLTLTVERWSIAASRRIAPPKPRGKSLSTELVEVIPIDRAG